MSFGQRKIPKHLLIEDHYHRPKSLGAGWFILALSVLVGSMVISMRVGADCTVRKGLAVESLSPQTQLQLQRSEMQIHRFANLA